MDFPQPSLLGQIPLNFYTQVLFGFPLATKDIEAAVHNLNSSLQVLVNNFPFLAGQVILEGKDSTSSGIYRVVLQEDAQILSVKESTALCPSFAEIAAAQAPTPMLDGNLLAPMKGIPGAHDRLTPLPVFLLQLNVVNGDCYIVFFLYAPVARHEWTGTAVESSCTSM
jgi:hypothetical protein